MNTIRQAVRPLVYVVIVNYNGIRWLYECLNSLSGTAYENFKILIVDNGSTDNSLEYVRSHFPQVEVIQNEANLGFAAGNNVGLSRAMAAAADYVVLLNSDTRVSANWLSDLIIAAEDNLEIGILGSVQLTYDGTDFNWWTRTIAREHLRELADLETAPQWISMPWVEGSCFAIRRCVLDEVGLLDPIYFMYFEEIDYCRRTLAHGYKVALVPRSRICHFGGGSSEADENVQRIKGLRYDRSNLIYHLTDFHHSFLFNLGVYFYALARRGIERSISGNFSRLWDIIKLQPKMLRALPSIHLKWKRDRMTLRHRVAKMSGDPGHRRS